MKTIKFLASSFFFGILISTLVLCFIADGFGGLSADRDRGKSGGESSLSLLSSLKSIFSSVLSYKQTSQYSGTLRIFGLSVKVDLELLQKIKLKADEIFGIIREKLPETAVSFALEFVSAAKDVAVSAFDALKSLFYSFNEVASAKIKL